MDQISLVAQGRGREVELTRKAAQISLVAQGMGREVELTRKVAQISSKVGQIKAETWIRSARWPRAGAGRRI